MFAVTKPIDGEVLDRRNLDFGDSFVLILNPQEFLNRVSTAAQNNHLVGEGRLVEYYDPECYSGDTGPFLKSSMFAHQKEFRIILRPGVNRAIELSIGDIADISSAVLPLSEMNNILDFSTASAHAAGLTI